KTDWDTTKSPWSNADNVSEENVMPQTRAHSRARSFNRVDPESDSLPFSSADSSLLGETLLSQNHPGSTPAESSTMVQKISINSHGRGCTLGWYLYRRLM